jgi:mRNA interferase RelE/StbE
LIYAKEARERIRSLPPEIKRGIRQTLEGLQENPYLGKPLRRELTGFWSLPFKHHRIIYRPLEGGKKLQIYSVGHRKEIYQEFAKIQKEDPSK